MDINFEYYKVFYYAAKYENITRAATALKRSQPNVTRIIRILESQLNCRLFIREPRGMKLTEEGQRLYAHVETACRHLLEAEAEILDRESGGRGTVTVGVTETALHLFLLEKLGAFKQKYPGIKIRIRNSSTPKILKALTVGKLDLAIVTTPYETSVDLMRKEMMIFQEILVGGDAYAQMAGQIIPLKELNHCPLIGLGEGTVTCEFYKRLFISHNTDYEPEMEVATSDLLLPLILHNIGVGFVAEPLARPLIEKGKLVRLLSDVTVPEREIHMVLEKGRGRSRAADIFCRWLEETSENLKANAGEAIYK